jgi:hypothetical protein
MHLDFGSNVTWTYTADTGTATVHQYKGCAMLVGASSLHTRYAAFRYSRCQDAMSRFAHRAALVGNGGTGSKL